MSVLSLNVAPSRVVRGHQVLNRIGELIAGFGKRPLLVGGNVSLSLAKSFFADSLIVHNLQFTEKIVAECSELSLQSVSKLVDDTRADVIVGVGGGKALDLAKLVADKSQLPIVTIPSTGATCAAWTALSNVYSEEGAFLYDVPLPKCPDLLILDYGLVQTAPRRTLVAGIGDAIAKWYEASVSSGHSERTMMIAAVQQARVLRDILLQKSVLALQEPGGELWQDVVDGTVLLAGVIGGIGGPQCRTVAAHAVHNGLTHIKTYDGSTTHVKTYDGSTTLTKHHRDHQMFPTTLHGSTTLTNHRRDHQVFPTTLHGEKVAYGILVQLRLEEMLNGNQLAASARQQLLKFYGEVGLPQSLSDLGLANISLTDLQKVAEIACGPNSDIHYLPFPVTPEQLMTAMISTKEDFDHKQQTVNNKQQITSKQ